MGQRMTLVMTREAMMAGEVRADDLEDSDRTAFSRASTSFGCDTAIHTGYNLGLTIKEEYYTRLDGWMIRTISLRHRAR